MEASQEAVVHDSLPRILQKRAYVQNLPPAMQRVTVSSQRTSKCGTRFQSCRSRFSAVSSSPVARAIASEHPRGKGCYVYTSMLKACAPNPPAGAQWRVVALKDSGALPREEDLLPFFKAFMLYQSGSVQDAGDCMLTISAGGRRVESDACPEDDTCCTEHFI